MTRSHLRSLVGALTVGTLACGTWGCARLLGDNRSREASTQVPNDYGGVQGGEGGDDHAASIAQAHFDAMFTDTELRALLEQALEHNQELEITMQDTIIAKAEVGARQGEYLPRLNAHAGVGLDKVGGRTSTGVSDDAHGVPTNKADFRFGLAASWEVDVWGKLRSAKKSANQRYLASVEAQRFVVTQIVAEISRSYYELIALDESLEVVERYISLTSDALEVVRLKKEAARATELAVQRFEAELSRAQARRYQLAQEQVVVENRINFLVGRFPQTVARSDRLLDKAAIGRVTKTGLPSELLDNRTDVRRAERALEAAKLETKSAKAAFYPALTLDAGVGYESFNAAHLVRTPESLVYGVAGGLIAPLLNRKGITAQYQTANAMQVQAVYSFEQAILRAFTEVVNELANLDNLGERQDRLSDQVDTLEDAVEVSNLLYRSAHADYMEVLLTRRDALDAELELIETERDQMLAVVSLYQALGGGWR